MHLLQIVIRLSLSEFNFMETGRAEVSAFNLSLGAGGGHSTVPRGHLRLPEHSLAKGHGQQNLTRVCFSVGMRLNIAADHRRMHWFIFEHVLYKSNSLCIPVPFLSCCRDVL
jgi:hypothetical protein